LHRLVFQGHSSNAAWVSPADKRFNSKFDLVEAAVQSRKLSPHFRNDSMGS
jgi:hypothetical protein